MPAIETVNLVKRFEKVTAVDGVNFSVGDGEYVSLVGPSGCGKSTLLRLLAGLERPSSGDILIDGASVASLPPEDRNIGFLFQNYELFPHLSVGENAGYGLFVRAASRDSVDSRVREVLRLVKLLEYAGFLPETISGGMKQRIALARALASGSKILFLDEPLSALDEKAGVLLRYEIQKTAKKLGLTVIHVSHSQETALSVSDRIVVMKAGRIVQSGPPREVYLNPVSPYVAYFLGDSNFMEAKRCGPSSAEIAGIKLELNEKPSGDNLVLAVRPSKVVLNDGGVNSFAGVVRDVNFLGYTTRYTVEAGGLSLRVRTAKHGHLREGDRVTVRLPPKDIMTFEGDFKLSEELSLT